MTALVSSFAGAQLYGGLPVSGLGSHVDATDVPDLEGTKHTCADSNQELRALLKEDVNARALHQITLDDHAKGRMSEPVRVGSSSRPPLGQVRLVPRFPITHGTKADGSPKIRAVDHMSWSARLHLPRKRTRNQATHSAGYS